MSLRFWGIVVIIVVVFAGILVFGQGPKKKTGLLPTADSGASPAPASVVSGVTSVKTATFDAIAQGATDSYPKNISGSALTENNKPEIFFEGAEYCPYCATERWPMAVALARFGTFKNLQITHSSTSDVYPDTKTLSFYGSTYTSPYIAFTSVEVYTNIPDGSGYAALQTPDTQQQNLINKYDSSGGIPFVDIDNKYLINDAEYNPETLAGSSWQEIAGSLNDPTSPIAQGVDGAANVFTAAICKVTENQPGSVCDATIQKLESKI